METPCAQPVKLKGCLSQISSNARVWNLSADELLNFTQNHNCSDQGCPVPVMATTTLRICAEIENFKLRACTQIWYYITDTRMEQIIWTMAKSMHGRFQEFISGIENGFIDLDLPTLQKDLLRISDQGVYAGIVHKACGQTRVYIGSSYGSNGLKKRIINGHLSRANRRREQEKPFYAAMEEEDVATFFIPLVIYKEVVEIGQVLLAESVCCAIFGTLNSEEYRQIRPEQLPKVDWNYGLNRSDPLWTFRTGYKTLGRDLTLYRRLRTLYNCLRSGPVRVKHYQPRGSYSFHLFEEGFKIPIELGRKWGLEHNSAINVEWDIANGTHPHAFAPLATGADDGRKVGIRVFTTENEHWIIRNTESAVLLANTLHDLLTGQIVGKRYRWDSSRKFIFRSQEYNETQNVANMDDFQPQTRIGLPYEEKFVWGDPTRRHETRPEDVIVQEPKDKEIEMDDSSFAETLEYQRYLQYLYRKYLLPHHRDLQSQGCRIDTGDEN